MKVVEWGVRNLSPVSILACGCAVARKQGNFPSGAKCPKGHTLPVKAPKVATPRKPAAKRPETKEQRLNYLQYAATVAKYGTKMKEGGQS